MFYPVIEQFIKTLENLDAIMEKAIRDAEARKFDPNNFITARLAPDMLPFPKQVQIACDVAKIAASNLTGKEAPKHEDNEKTMTELRERIGKCVTYLKTFKASDFSDLDPKKIVKVAFPAGKAMEASEFLYARGLPNFFFHVSMTYALLRQGGVPLGKMDLLGKLNIFDA